jgi:hypothetical protein
LRAWVVIWVPERNARVRSVKRNRVSAYAESMTRSLSTRHSCRFEVGRRSFRACECEYRSWVLLGKLVIPKALDLRMLMNGDLVW